MILTIKLLEVQKKYRSEYKTIQYKYELKYRKRSQENIRKFVCVYIIIDVTDNWTKIED